MTGTGIIGLLLIAINVVVSYKGFNNHFFFDKYKFEVEKILLYKDYKRLVTSGFLHVNWTHLIFNMISLLMFSGLLESYGGGFEFLLIYVAGLVGGDLLSLLIHKHDPDYSSVGASGAVCGLIFAAIALFPGFNMGLFFIPISIPGWLFGLLFVGFSMYGIKSRRDNVGYEAHLGGALVGMAVALLLHPSAFLLNYPAILVIAVPTIVFIYLIVTRPHLLLIDNYFFKTHREHYSIDHKYNEAKHVQQKEIDRILDKINSRGMSSLSKKEREDLDRYSRASR
ncbi:MAG: rhomboid family intramembrane serine protease [Williamsia sp.]|nr:rhomboid family intramembrane serine protease [Williamsia sp.]